MSSPPSSLTSTCVCVCVVQALVRACVCVSCEVRAPSAADHKPTPQRHSSAHTFAFIICDDDAIRMHNNPPFRAGAGCCRPQRSASLSLTGRRRCCCCCVDRRRVSGMTTTPTPTPLSSTSAPTTTQRRFRNEIYGVHDGGRCLSPALSPNTRTHDNRTHRIPNSRSSNGAAESAGQRQAAASTKSLSVSFTCFHHDVNFIFVFFSLWP